MLGELDNALLAGARALAVARRIGDLRLRLLTTINLDQAHYFRGEYERVVDLATDNLMALPAESVYEVFRSRPADVVPGSLLAGPESRRARPIR
jgi:hypothetical protein